MISDERILDAARDVFLESGIQATTAQVALRAGVSEGSIFKRFRTKAELFQAAMSSMNEPPLLKDLGARVGSGVLRDDLYELGLGMIGFFRNIVPLMMMAWSNPGPGGLPHPLSGPNPPPIRAMKSLAGFFDGEMRAGRLRRSDPEIVARAFLGSLHTFAFFEIVLRQSGELPMPAETYVRGLVALLLDGVGVRDGDPARAETPRVPAAQRPQHKPPTPRANKRR